MTRLPAQPGERIDRTRPLSFTFDGKPVQALAGDTIASALAAAGQKTFSRSFKYHRRRGLLCCSGNCVGCLVSVDGAPGIRACTEPAKDGQVVEHLNAKPSLEHDAMAITDKLGGHLTPPGFYYKTFMRPQRLWPYYERALRNVAGLGEVPEQQPERTWHTEYRRRHADVLIVGGGAAGLSAAIAAAKLGADTVLADDGQQFGGRLLWEGGHAMATDLVAQAKEAGVELLDAAPAFGNFDGLTAVWQGSTLHQIRSRVNVFATGAVEQPLIFAGNDLPGVMLAGGAQRLACGYSVSPGSRAVVVSAGERGPLAALALAKLGVQIVALADLRPTTSAEAQQLVDEGVELLNGFTVVAAEGKEQVQSVTLAPLAGGAPSTDKRTHRKFDCDLLVVSGGESPATALATQAGALTEYDPELGVFALSQLPANLFAAGQLAGCGELDAALASGELAGLEAAAAAGFDTPDTKQRVAALAGELAARHDPAQALPPVDVGDPKLGRSIVCLCEDVAVKDIKQAISEGYDSVELCKRYSTTTMGPCQGRMCHLAAVRLIAETNGRTPSQIGATTTRPPYSTVPLAILAGSRLTPAKRSPLHRYHECAGARISWAGDWLRAYDYGDLEGEVAAVHDRAGLIDVSPLGKLLVTGPQAPELLDRIYPSVMSNLEVGRLRYGLMTNAAGRITDDGTICRLDEQSFYVTTTSSGAAGVLQWFEWWLMEWGLDATVVDLTQALCAINLAGPLAREILAPLTDIDLSPDSFGYLRGRQGKIAGIDALALRVGFVGELGYEIHASAGQGRALWDAILDAGEPRGLRPFGVEAQRVLRLEKGHAIIGQDTNAEATPYNAGMSWAVKLDKPQAFVGSQALSLAAEKEPAQRLVGFTFSGKRIPTEGSVVLAADGSVGGEITSARRSRKLDAIIGLAWVPAAQAVDGSSLTISDRDQRIEASVVTGPFYDRDGERQRA